MSSSLFVRSRASEFLRFAEHESFLLGLFDPLLYVRLSFPPPFFLLHYLDSCVFFWSTWSSFRNSTFVAQKETGSSDVKQSNASHILAVVRSTNWNGVESLQCSLHRTEASLISLKLNEQEKRLHLVLISAE